MSGLRCSAFVVALVSVGSAAHADTIDLVCQQNGASYGLDVIIDTTASTAVAWSSGSSRQGQPVNQGTITEDQVTWGPSIVNAPQFTLDRKSGVLTMLRATGWAAHLRFRRPWSARGIRPFFD
jgi:hypothetical protein